MSISVILNNGEKYHLLYSANGFQEGLTVTGYFIYPDFQKSSTFTFDELGDGIYSVAISYDRKTDSYTEKHGLVVKEDGVVKKFEILQIRN